MTAESRALSGAFHGRRLLVALSLILCALTVPDRFEPGLRASAADTNTAAAAQTPATDLEIADLVLRLEAALGTGDPAQYLALVSPSADRPLAETFAREIVRPGITRAVVRERDRAPLPNTSPDEGMRLIVEVFLQSGSRSTVSTWRLDVTRDARSDRAAAPPRAATPAAPAGGPVGATGKAGADTSASARWTILVQDRLTTVEGLHRLSIDAKRQYRARNLRVTGEDFTLTLPNGVAFAATADSGATAYVLMGRGEMIFKPKPAAERGQIKLFADDETLRTPFEAVFIRLNPGDLGARFTPGALVEERVDPRALGRAQEIFAEEVPKSFNLDLSDLSRESWSLVPPFGDMLVEVRTTRYGTLTYTQAGNESEDVSLFDRRKRRNIASYASERKLATRARFYSDNDEVDYDVLHYDVQSHFSPEREWIEGRTVVRLKVTAYILGTLTLRLAEPLVVQSVTSPRFGRLLSLRVKGQNSVLVNLPQPLARGDELTLAVTYAGRLETATPEREVIALGADAFDAHAGEPGGQSSQGEIRSELTIPPEPRVLYTNRSYWYPQSTVTDYATASIRLTVPEGQSCVATGTPASGNPVRLDAKVGEQGRLLYVFAATQPARYLAVVITRLTQSVTDIVRLPRPTATLARNAAIVAEAARESADAPQSESGPPAASVPAAAPGQPPTPLPGKPDVPQTQPREGTFYESLDLAVASNPRQAGRVRAFVEQASSILSRYAEIVGDLPYPSFTLTLVDDPLPGGHSPAYFALLHQPLPTTTHTWRNDPVSFDKFPQFFLAHELAHQYWGDAVGGENYHEQWISEGFAQYFAVLHAERTRSKGTFEDILRQMRRTSIAYDRYGPVWLGYRLGHLQGDSRIFRALVYNKGALVLHMLRRLMGDDAFFRGLRRFYLQSRFTKVGTDDVRKAFEEEAGRSLEAFFERWIMQSGVAQLAVTQTVSDGSPPRGAGTGRETGTASGVSTSDPSNVTAGTLDAAAMPLLAAQSPATSAPGSAAPQKPSSVGSDPQAPATAGSAGPKLMLRFEQKTGELYEFPLTVRLRYVSGDVEDVIVIIDQRTVERTFPLKGRLQTVVVNDDDAALVEVNGR